MTESFVHAEATPRRGGGIALALLGVSVAMTWPLGRVWTPELPTGPDASFNVWRLAWIAHQLGTNPTALFDANIFHPASLTFAYSDAMLLIGLLGTPWLWLGVHPFAVHNALVVAAFWTASVATYRLSVRVAGHKGAALAGAIVGGYAPYRFGHTAHLELLWTAFIPLALLALLTFWDRPTVAAACRLALCQILQTLCSIYYGVFLAISLGIATLALALRDRKQIRACAMGLAVASLVTAGALAPYAAVYVRVRSDVPERTPAEIATYSGIPSDYLHVSYEHELPFPRGHDAVEERSLYPGAIAVILAVVAVTKPRRDVVFFALLLVVAVEMSLGTNGLMYPGLLTAFPPLTGLRAPARFGAIVITALAVLSAAGAARLLAGRTTRWTLALLVAMLAEYLAAPIQTRREPMTPPPVYAWLAGQPDGVVLELPLPVPDELWAYESHYQLMSIYHWKPLVNGYSGHAPTDYVRFLDTMRDFPSDRSLDAIRARDVRWLIVHEGLIPQADQPRFIEAVLRQPGLRPVGAYADVWGSASIFELHPDKSVSRRRNPSRQ